MATAVLVRGGARVAVVRAGRVDPATRWELPGERAAELFAAGAAATAPPELVRLVRSLPDPVACDDPVLASKLERAGVRLGPLEFADRRAARRAFFQSVGAADRSFLLDLAERELLRQLGSPMETLIALAREEERVERAVRREVGAADQWLAGDVPVLATHGKEWAQFREVLAAHHHRVEERLERQAALVVPNLAELVGGRVAARLVALAGSVDRLGRMSAARLQLLGTRRRPSPVRGPRFGVIMRASRAGDVPPDRLAAFARSVAALAAIAARADSSTRSPVATELVRRRDRRVEQLRRRRRS